MKTTFRQLSIMIAIIQCWLYSLNICC